MYTESANNNNETQRQNENVELRFINIHPSLLGWCDAGLGRAGVDLFGWESFLCGFGICSELSVIDFKLRANSTLLGSLTERADKHARGTSHWNFHPRTGFGQQSLTGSIMSF